jgi:predicted phosphodiesterase
MSTARIALFGGLYSNYLALAAAVANARRRGVDAIYCLGDLGAFGPHPDRVFPLLVENSVACVRGNYDDSIGRGLADCQCGYTDPRDNHFAQISYDYTLANTSDANRAWLRALPGEIRFDLGPYRALLCHGSPRRMNEFLWESTSPTHFLDQLADQHAADVLCCTHTGLKWQRELSGGRQGAPVNLGPQAGSRRVDAAVNPGVHAGPSVARHFINVGVLGRPENDGRTNVWYALLEVASPLRVPSALQVEFIPVEYDHHRLAAEMRAEKLPAEFIETILTGWWTTCLEVLPQKERRRGRC